MSAPAVRAAVLHMLPDHLRMAGVCADAVFRAGGMEPGLCGNAAIVHRAQVSAVLEAAAHALGQAHVGLSLGAVAEPSRLGPAGLALLSGQSIAHGLHAHAAMMPAMQTHLRMALRVDAGEAVWSHRFEGEAVGVSRILCEGAAAFHLQFIRQLLGAEWSPSRVVFPHACRGKLADYEDHFGAPVVFGEGDESRIVFDAGVLRRRIIAPAAPAIPGPAGPERELIAFQLRDKALLQAVRAMVTARLPQEPVKLDVCARILGVSPRTLQRRLGELGATFETLVDELRRDLAIDRLAAGAMVTDVAMSLGYSDTAHFTRAFRRWTGRTPSEFRNRPS